MSGAIGGALVLALGGVLGGAALAPAAFTPPGMEVIAAQLAQARPGLPERLLDVTAPFVGAPYVLSPLGEGAGASPDPDPRMRLDAFDCTTFVETAVALALAGDLREAQGLLDVLRYRDGAPGWLARRHFPEAEWIPELTRLGFLEDITRQVGGSDVVVERKALSPVIWRRSHNKAALPDLPDDRIPTGVFELSVWPLAQARAQAAQIPAGTILHLVRVDFRNVPVRVSHQGIVLDKDGQKVLRHAADRMYHAVVDEPLERFLSRMAQYARWPVAGVHLTAVRAPANWRALLPSTAVPAGPAAPSTSWSPPSATTTPGARAVSSSSPPAPSTVPSSARDPGR